MECPICYNLLTEKGELTSTSTSNQNPGFLQPPPQKRTRLVTKCPAAGTDSADSDAKLSSTPCGHIFHHICIKDWLDRGNKTCPTCRKATTKRQLRPVFLTNNPVSSSSSQNSEPKSSFDDLLAVKDKQIKDQQALINQLQQEKMDQQELIDELTKKGEDVEKQLKSLRKYKNDLNAMNAHERDMAKTLSTRITNLEAELNQLRRALAQAQEQQQGGFYGVFRGIF